MREGEERKRIAVPEIPLFAKACALPSPSAGRIRTSMYCGM